MKTISKVLAVALVTFLAACSGMSRQDRDTLIGAGVGGAVGNAVTGGSTTGTVGGAVVGGALGHEQGKK